jgi:hypothetical protein
LSTTASFAVFLALTVLLLLSVVATGLKARRKLHITLVALTLASLGATIYFAEQLGELYDVESAGAITPIHLALAKITTLFYLLPIATGVRTIYVPKTRPLHRKVALTVLALTVVTLVTGLLMVTMSEPIAQG